MEFEWDEETAASNLERHGVSFSTIRIIQAKSGGSDACPHTFDQLVSTVHAHYVVRCRRTAPMIDWADRSTSSSVVDQFDTEIRIASLPCHRVMPSQQTRSSCTSCSASRVAASASPFCGATRTSTWFSTTSLRI